jgi:ribulose-phosphate 3-epimerase
MEKILLVLACIGCACDARHVAEEVPTKEAQSLASFLLSLNPSAVTNRRTVRPASRNAQQSSQKRNAVMQEASCELLEGDKFLIAPSILSANFAKLGEEVDNVLAAGADVVHFDVMDNHYVPNLTIGPMVCKALRDHGVTAPIDVHLMVSPVDRIVEDFCKAGASYITFHPEASPHIDRTLQLIKQSGCKAGLVFNPGTSLDAAKYVMDKLDIILLMSVNPGFGGQSFIDGTMNKLREARKMIDDSGYKIRLEIDGGVSPANIKDIAEAGADMFVAGSAILKEPRTEDAYKVTIDGMREELASVKA